MILCRVELTNVSHCTSNSANCKRKMSSCIGMFAYLSEGYFNFVYRKEIP